MYRASGSIALVELGRDGSIYTVHEIELTGTRGRRGVAALDANEDGLRLAIVQQVSSGPESVRLLRIDREGTVVERRHGELPERTAFRGVQWTDDKLVVDGYASQHGPTLHRFTFP